MSDSCNRNFCASARSSAVASFKVMDVLQRANELEAQGRHILHCEVGQPETGAPILVSAAAVQALTGPPPEVMGYTEAFGLPALRTKIASHYLEKYENISRASVDISKIVVTTGSSGGFLLAFTAAFDAGDVVGIASSGYPCYRNILTALGCELATIPLNEEFTLTAVQLKSEIDRRAIYGEKPLKGLILSSPSNPTGAMLDSDELKDLCEMCDNNGIQFLSDEIYHGISYGTKKESTALSFSKSTIVINSFSKYYSMSGWRLGWLVLPDHLIDSVNKLQQNMFINAPTISQTAALRCWDTETIEELEKHVAKYERSRQIILDELKQITDIDPKNIAPADGGFYVYIDLGESNVAQGLGSVAMCSSLLEEAGVAFTPGTDFEDPSGEYGDRRFRISYAGGVDTVKQAMERFRDFFPKWLEKVHNS